MDKNTALETFYKNNSIDPIQVNDPQSDCYDRHLADLPDKVDQWLLKVPPKDRDVFLQLLSKYTYLRRAQCQLRYVKILANLEDHLSAANMDISQTLIITVEAGGAYASGGDNVRTDLLARTFEYVNKKQVVAAQSRLEEDELHKYQAILFLDDVIGSGVTLWGTICYLKDRFPEWFGRQKIFCGSIAPRSRGVKHIKDNCKREKISLEWLHDLDWIQQPAFANNSAEFKILEPYERLIGEYMTEEDITFFMGFQKNRLLLSFYYNTPNNTLSTFWRIGPETKPLFYRNGNQVSPKRPALSDLRTQKKQMSQQAYSFGTDRWRHKCNGDPT